MFRNILSIPLVTVSALLAGVSVHGDERSAAQGTVTPLLTQALTGIDGKEVSMVTVTYPPGGASPAHRHNADAFVYVLEGSVVMQVEGGAPVTLSAGQTFHESPSDVHQVSRNASDTKPAKILAILVKNTGAPATLPVQ
jgi:quercetin dioxygenase-like cupin family protein